jgi:hypothetical protein
MVVDILLMIAKGLNCVTKCCNRLSLYLLQKAEEILDG